ncbi:MAG: sigma-54 dependent transcriptional regulator [Alphaproteobacteria bacterium]|nr:sigma-54 dependent transcriptional regulator [Alphaproteobacteria bacterium]
MKNNVDILVVDDEDDIRNLICSILEDEGYETRGTSGSKSAYEQIEKKIPDLVILDIWLQGSKDDGIEILKNIKKQNPLIEVLMISGHGNVETAVSAIKIGAYDFIEKPFKSDRLLLMIHRALESSALKKENSLLREKSKQENQSPVDYNVLSQKTLSLLERVAPSNSRVIISGEIGTGKSLAARYIHEHSSRSKKPFIIYNCQNDDPARMEAELFGHGSDAGLFHQAQNGTVLLEEIDHMPLDIQGKFARILQDNNFSIQTDAGAELANIRFMASSSGDIKKAVEDGKLREDLFYRLNVVHIQMESLRHQKSEFSNIVEILRNQLSRETGLKFAGFSDKALDALKAYHWAGNLRQLRNVLEWVAIMTQGKDCAVYDVSHLPSEIAAKKMSPENDNKQISIPEKQENIDFMTLPLREAREHFERDYLLRQINRFDGNISKTAQFIGMERSALHRKLKILEILATTEKESASG